MVAGFLFLREGAMRDEKCDSCSFFCDLPHYFGLFVSCFCLKLTANRPIFTFLFFAQFFLFSKIEITIVLSDWCFEVFQWEKLPLSILSYISCILIFSIAGIIVGIIVSVIMDLKISYIIRRHSFICKCYRGKCEKWCFLHF